MVMTAKKAFSAIAREPSREDSKSANISNVTQFRYECPIITFLIQADSKHENDNNKKLLFYIVGHSFIPY